MGTLFHSCAEVREPIELSFGGGVSGVGPGIDVLDGVDVLQVEGGFGMLWRVFPIGLNGVLLRRNVLDSCVKYFRTGEISLETYFHWFSEYIVRFNIEVRVFEKFAKM